MAHVPAASRDDSARRPRPLRRILNTREISTRRGSTHTRLLRISTSMPSPLPGIKLFYGETGLSRVARLKLITWRRRETSRSRTVIARGEKVSRIASAVVKKKKKNNYSTLFRYTVACGIRIGSPPSNVQRGWTVIGAIECSQLGIRFDSAASRSLCYRAKNEARLNYRVFPENENLCEPPATYPKPTAAFAVEKKGKGSGRPHKKWCRSMMTMRDWQRAGRCGSRSGGMLFKLLAGGQVRTWRRGRVETRWNEMQE